MTTLIANAHIISPDLEIEKGHILIQNHKIVKVIRAGEATPTVDQVFDIDGNYACPGFIDIHAHGADGFDVCDNDLNSIRHIAQKKLEEGVTTWLPTTLTQPREKLRDIALTFASYRENQEYAKTPGLHLEGPFINPSKAGAQNPEFIRPPDAQELAELNQIAPIKLLSLAPCQQGSIQVIAKAKSLNIKTSAAHTEASAAQISAAKDAGLTQLTHFGNAMSPLHHREIGSIGAGLLDKDLLLELICDSIHLAPDFIKLIFQIKPIETLMLITDSMAGSWLEDGHCQLGGLDVTIKDNIARLKHNDELAGSTLRYNQGLRTIHELTDIPLHQLIKTTSWNQAHSLELPLLGKIEPQHYADITVLNKEFNIQQTFLNGQPML